MRWLKGSQLCAALSIITLLVFGLHAQTQAPPRRLFEVASIKPNISGPPAGAQTNPLVFSPGGRFTAINVTLVDVIVRVYPTRRIQMQGGPAWIDSDRFDIIAKADEADGEVTQEQKGPMVQALLEDRFKLTFHKETKDMQVYALVLGKDAPKLKTSEDGGVNTFLPGLEKSRSASRLSIGWPPLLHEEAST